MLEDRIDQLTAYAGRKTTLAILGGVLTLAAVLLWLAPAEQTLGAGIKVVYVHVALIWTGMTGLMVAALLGLGAAIWQRKAVQGWAQTIGWVALAFFAAGLAMSAVAAWVNWGAVFWQEPRTARMLQVLALGLIVQVVNGWLGPVRVKGLLHLLPAGALLWSVAVTPLVLHPPDAARSAPPLMRFVFFGLFLLCALAAAAIAFRLRRLRREQTTQVESR